MKKAISLFLALVMCLSLCACGGGNDTPETIEVPTETTTQNNGLTEEQVIGTWEWRTFGEQGPINGVTHMELYEGGTGKGTNSSMTGGSYYPITWEIKGDVINISASNAPTIGLKLEDGKLVAVDGTVTYTRIEN